RFTSDLYALDFNFHGSFVSGLIASNGLGSASVAPSARVCTRKVLSEDGIGTFGDVAAAIVYAADYGANVINMSLGAYFDTREDGGSQLIALLQSAVDFAVKTRGVVVVASAGNSAINLDTDAPSLRSIPAQLDGVISVGATGPDLSGNYDALASYSNFGGKTGIDLVAPGGDLPDPNNHFDLILSVCSTFVCGATNFYVLGAGTSFSAPHVSATAAIVQAMLGGAPSPAAVTKCITEQADHVGPKAIFGAGRLNVLNAALCGTGGT
ncbi:MAG: S8 family serine peptidase, partial [Gemmatimonadaceae bacterium]